MENEKRQRRIRLMGMFPKLLFVVLFSMATTTVALAQSKTVTGTVVDNTGEPIIGASVIVDGSTNGTITDFDGNFSLANVANNATLKVSYIGYLSQNISAAGKTSFRIVLIEDAQTLDEVVVVGYGVQKKSDITGAMVRVGEKEMKAMPVQNALQAMQGKTAGVDITSNERPGEMGKVRIRGERSIGANSDPLYVVDGIPLQGLGIENLNPSDIESIDILKDASATAIYGSRGANGVILVTTKKGKSGKMSVNYSGTLNIEKMHDRADMMNSQEWLDYARLALHKRGTYKSATPDYDQDKNIWGSIGASWANIEKGWNNGAWDGSLVPNYDWTSHGLQTAISHEHTLSASGGTDKMQAYLSFGYMNQEGTQPGQKYQRYTGKTSIDMTPTDWLKLGVTINVSWGDQEYGYNFRKSKTGAANIYDALKGMLPWTVPYDEDGGYIRNPAAGDVNIINPIREVNLSQNQRQSLRTFGSLYAEINIGNIITPLKGLRYRMNFGPDFYYYRNGIFADAESINGDGNNVATYNTHNKQAWTLDNLLYYDNTFGKHNLGLTLLQTASSYRRENGDMTANGVYTNFEQWYNLYSAGELSSFGTGLTETSMESYMIRANYGFADKYLLTVSGRWDGASQLADGNKWDFFPSAAIGWRIEQESFMENVEWVNALKLRFGFGTTGNAAINAYGTQGLLTPLYYTWGSTQDLGYVASDPSLAANDQMKMQNKNLGWEKTTQYNLGVDFSLLNGRLSGSLDVYKSKTKDLLLLKSIPSLTGYISTYDNVGETENKGVDITLNTVNVQTRDFSWTTDFTYSKDKNKILSLADGREEDVDNKWFVGKEIGVYYDYVYDGIWKTDEAEEAAKYGRVPGEIRVKDLSGADGVPDGSIDQNYDRAIIGSARPKWTAGMMNTFTYKNWELSAFIYARWKFTVETGAETLSGRFAMRKIDYWVEGSNENALYYAPGTGGESGDTYKNAMNYQDGSFIKLRNISLGYNFTKKQLAKTGVENLKVYAQCMNPGMIYSKCNWIDADLGGSTYNRGFVFGINVGF